MLETLDQLLLVSHGGHVALLQLLLQPRDCPAAHPVWRIGVKLPVWHSQAIDVRLFSLPLRRTLARSSREKSCTRFAGSMQKGVNRGTIQKGLLDPSVGHKEHCRFLNHQMRRSIRRHSDN
jgi:hypothetical protein